MKRTHNRMTAKQKLISELNDKVLQTIAFNITNEETMLRAKRSRVLAILYDYKIEILRAHYDSLYSTIYKRKLAIGKNKESLINQGF